MNAVLAARRLHEEMHPLEPPIDLSAVCAHLGVVLCIGEADALDAVYMRVSGRGMIVLNGLAPRRRLRFSLAHEVGHHVLNHPPASACLSEPDPRPKWQERAADRFAAELLMPKLWLAREAHTMTLTALAERYRVSLDAMRIQLETLGIVPKGGATVELAAYRLRGDRLRSGVAVRNVARGASALRR